MYVAQDWSELDYAKPGKKFKVSELGPEVDAELVERADRPKDHYGEPIQGEDEAYLIFKVGDRYFKKSGYQNSYGDETTWNGRVTEVFAEEKTVLEFRSKR